MIPSVPPGYLVTVWDGGELVTEYAPMPVVPAAGSVLVIDQGGGKPISRWEVTGSEVFLPDPGSPQAKDGSPLYATVHVREGAPGPEAGPR